MAQVNPDSSTVAPGVWPEPPAEDIINKVLDPDGRTVARGLEDIYTPEQCREFDTVFRARHLIADEIERLLALLDLIAGDDDLELNLAGYHSNQDPRLDDAEGVNVNTLFCGSYVADEDAELDDFGENGHDAEDDRADYEPSSGWPERMIQGVDHGAGDDREAVAHV